jgi:hypothetical protein
MDTLQQIGTNNTQAFKIVEVSFKGRPVNEICKLEWNYVLFVKLAYSEICDVSKQFEVTQIGRTYHFVDSSGMGLTYYFLVV